MDLRRRLASIVRWDGDDHTVGALEGTFLPVLKPAAWAERSGWPALTRLGMGSGGEGSGARRDTVCPVTGRAVSATSPTWPFADERARLADLYKWFAEGYTVSRPSEWNDLEETE